MFVYRELQQAAVHLVGDGQFKCKSVISTDRLTFRMTVTMLLLRLMFRHFFIRQLTVNNVIEYREKEGGGGGGI